jgi:cysteine sulfinate desulfinase/cysteine desulfurase-like protein
MAHPIYLDYNGTTPHDPEVIEAMRPYLEHEFGNPSSSHWYGIAPKQAVENARRQMASLLNCEAEEISHVLQAMGIDREWAMGTLRFSVGRMTTVAEIDRALAVIIAAVGKLMG